ncbi:DUF6879 family protein [Saccharothrix lopnurensis]|uniref:DUF6879 family protein n=1 Tax=Saccharothrix lopnurensis TaxID=1670621 RepID=A0ABW1P067_9PSEU
MDDSGWNDFIRAKVADGVRRDEVHVCRGPLTDHERWALERPCADTERAGQRLYVLDLAEVAEPPELPDYDYWMYDESAVVRMLYDEDGKHPGHERLPDAEVAAHVAHRNAAVAAATSCPEYRATHPVYWRENRARTGDRAG